MRRNEIGRRLREAERRKLAALHSLRRRQSTAARIARHIIERGSVTSASADEEAVGAIGAHKRLLPGQAQGSGFSDHLRARGKRIIAISALLQRRNDQSAP